MRRFILLSFFAFLPVLWLTNCRLPDYYIERNKPDEAFKYAANKLKRKKLKTKHLLALEYGFNKANDRDIALIENLKNNESLISWKKIHYLNTGLLMRQQKIEPYMPMVSEEGYRPFVKLNPVKEWEEESFWKVTDLYLKEIRENLQLAVTGKKLKAREANSQLLELVERHGYNSSETIGLEDSTYMLGKSYFLLNMAVSSNIWHGGEIIDWLHGYGYHAGKNIWKEFHLTPHPNIEYDFVVEIKVNNTYISGENVSSSCEYFEKEIEVGKKEIRDTSGKVTYEPIYEKINATVTSYTLTKNASVSGQMIVFSPKNQAEIFRTNISGTDSYCDSYCTISGDTRAASKSCFGCIRSFPSDRDMLYSSVGHLSGNIRRFLKSVDVIE